MTRTSTQFAWFALTGLAVVTALFAFSMTAHAAGGVKVTVIKMVDGSEATSMSAGNQSFPMTATWNDPMGIGTGTGAFSLTPDTTPAYEAQTAELQPGADYGATENTGGSSVGADCSTGQPYKLVGYSTGDSRAAAESSAPSMSAPALTNIQNDKYIIVWNASCVPAPMPVAPANGTATTTAGQTSVDWTDVTDAAGGITYIYQSSNSPLTNPDGSFVTPVYTSGPLSDSSIQTPNTPDGTYYWHAMATDANNNQSPWSQTWSFTINNTTPPTATSTEKVYIAKYINGAQATVQNASSSSFTMSATWNDPMGVGAGTGTYTLDGNSTPAYQTNTVDLQKGADYSTSEANGGNVGMSCASGAPYMLDGYTTGNSMQEAQNATATTTAPAFTNLQSNKYVIVWNKTCDNNGSIGGTVQGSNGVLAVTSIDAVDTTAMADNSYADGWTYLFHVTVPTDEPGVAMKFSDWTSNGTSTIPVGGNMRISSAQADNGGATIPIVAANTYTTPDLHMVTDLNPAMDGIQTEIKVEVKIPFGTQNASYTTNYGVRSE